MNTLNINITETLELHGVLVMARLRARAMKDSLGASASQFHIALIDKEIREATEWEARVAALLQKAIV